MSWVKHEKIPTTPHMAEIASNLAKKLEADHEMYKKWLSAVLPSVADFLYFGGPGRNAEVVILDKNSEVLNTIRAGSYAANYALLTLIRSPDDRFRLESSSDFMSASGVMSLIECLETCLHENSPYRGDIQGLLYSFHDYTTSEKYCPEVAKAVKEILGE